MTAPVVFDAPMTGNCFLAYAEQVLAPKPALDEGANYVTHAGYDAC